MLIAAVADLEVRALDIGIISVVVLLIVTHHLLISIDNITNITSGAAKTIIIAVLLL